MKRLVSSVHKMSQTDDLSRAGPVVEQEVTVTLPMPPQPRPHTRPARPAKIADPEEILDVRENLETSSNDSCEVGSGDSDETGSEDESIKYDTIKKTKKIRDSSSVEKESEVTVTEKPRELSVERVVEPTPAASSDSSTVEASDVKKLSPSEEVVCPLVDQLVSDSVLDETDDNCDASKDSSDKKAETK